MVEQSRPEEANRSTETVLRHEFLATPPVVGELIHQVGRAVPDLGAIRPYLPSALDLSAKVGIYAEAFLEHAMTNLSKTPEWKGKLKMRPLAEKNERDESEKKYRFVNNAFVGHEAIKKSTGYQFVEYDLVTDVGGHPVVWEVKTIKPKGQELPHRMKSTFAPYRIYQLADPLKDIYPEPFSFSYVVVMNPEKVNPQEPMQSAFIERGGIILPLAVAYSQLVEGVRRLEGN